MESRRMILKNLQGSNGETDIENRQQWRNRQREQTYGHGERGGEGKMYAKSNMETYITICKTDSKLGICCMAQETQTRALNQARGWIGEGDGREFQKVGDICIPMADSC